MAKRELSATQAALIKTKIETLTPPSFYQAVWDIILQHTRVDRREKVCGDKTYRLYGGAVQEKNTNAPETSYRYIDSINPSDSTLISCINELHTEGEFLPAPEV